MVTVLLLAALMGCSETQEGDQGAAAAPGVTDSNRDVGATVERGRYIVTTAGCHDCHTPFQMGPEGPEPDMTRALSGHPQDLVMPPPPQLEPPWLWAGAATNTAFSGPWGVSYAMNLTPDTTTGIGVWNEEIFMRAIRTGRHMGGGRPIMPPMPWPVYAQLTDEDLRSVYAYLRTIEPIRNRVPEYQPPPDSEGPGT